MRARRKLKAAECYSCGCESHVLIEAKIRVSSDFKSYVQYDAHRLCIQCFKPSWVEMQEKQKMFAEEMKNEQKT